MANFLMGMNMPKSNATSAGNATYKVAEAISGTRRVQRVLSTAASTARMLDGQWIPEVATNLPGVKQSLKFFGKVVEKPVAAISHALLSSYVKKVIKKQLHSAKEALASHSMIKSALNYALSYVPTWAKDVAKPVVDYISDEALERLACKMLEMLDPLITAPTADLVAKGTGHLAVESAKFYVGHKLQVMVMAYLAEQLKEGEYPMVSTTISYVKKADDYRVTLAIFTLMLAANFLPALTDRLFSSEESAVKTKLKEQVLSKSGIDANSLPGKVYAQALGATIEHLVQAKIFNISQLKIALPGEGIAEPAQRMAL